MVKSDKMPLLFDLKELWNIYSHSPIPTLILSKEGEFIEYNDAMYELTGYTHDEVPDIAALMPKIFLAEEYRNKVIEISRKSRYREINIQKEEFIITRKDGKKLYIEFSVYDLLHKGKPTDLQIVQGTDITERKKAEEELLLNSEMIKNMTEGVYLVGIDDVIIKYTNPKFDKMFGYNAGEMIGKHASIVNAPTDKNPLERASEIMKVIHETGEWHGEVNNIKKDGTLFWCYANVSVFDHPVHGNVLMAVHTDITDRKKAEEALKESETMLQMSQNISKIGSFEMSLVTGNVKWSNQLYKLFGIKKGGKYIEYEKVLALIHPDDREHAIKVSSNAVEQGKSYELEHRIILSNGEILDLMIKGDVVYNENNEKIKIVGITQDITERKKAENELKLSKLELQKQKSEIEQKNIALREVIGQIEVEKNEIKNDIMTNLNEIILPIIKKIKLKETSNEYIDLLQILLEKTSSSFGRKITKISYKLTPREIEICTLIESDLSNKDISVLLNISCRTIENHRKNIRNKLGITNKNINLSSFLLHL